MSENGRALQPAHEENIAVALTAFRREVTTARRQSVRRAIEAYVDTLREDQALPEHVVIALNAVILRAGLRQVVTPSQRLIRKEEDLVADELITYAIAWFFWRDAAEHASSQRDVRSIRSGSLL